MRGSSRLPGFAILVIVASLASRVTFSSSFNARGGKDLRLLPSAEDGDEIEREFEFRGGGGREWEGVPVGGWGVVGSVGW